MKNIFIKRLLMIFRDFGTLFWTWVFPILLSTLFAATIPKSGDAVKLAKIELGIINSDEYKKDEIFKSVIASLSSDEGETVEGNILFNVNLFENEQEAETALKDDKIKGYIMMNDGNPDVFVKVSGISQTVIKSVMETYIHNKEIIMETIEKDPLSIMMVQEMLTSSDGVKSIKVSENAPSTNSTYFYSLLGMVCMYGAFQGLITVSTYQPNLSALGARTTISPTSRFKTILTDLLAGFTAHTFFVVVVIAYMRFALNVDFGNRIGLVILTCIIGSFVGVAFGCMVSSLTKFKESVKVAIIISTTMVFSFLSGMMVGGLDFIIAKKAPILSWINPVARITNSFYALSIYDNLDKFILNMIILGSMSVICFVLTFLTLRRQSFESI